MYIWILSDHFNPQDNNYSSQICFLICTASKVFGGFCVLDFIIPPGIGLQVYQNALVSKLLSAKARDERWNVVASFHAFGAHQT